MDSFKYPNSDVLKFFILFIKESNFPIIEYLPHTNKEWFEVISGCIDYVHHISSYHEDSSIYEPSARILYKITKKHELGDGNKRSAVICVYLFCILNGYSITDPAKLKNLAKRIASTKGRINEETMKSRIAKSLENITEPI